MPNSIIVLVLALLFAGCATAPSMSAATVGDPERGARLFTQGQEDTPPCSTCHRVVSGQVGFSIGPNLARIAERAGTQVAGLSAEEYLRQSILEPRRYVVSGYRDIMYPDYSAHLTEQNIQDLIAYLLTL
jgi:cytochrome c2